MISFGHRHGRHCCDSHRMHAEGCDCPICTKSTNGKILEISCGSNEHLRPFFYDYDKLTERVRQCLDSRLMETRYGRIRGHRPYQMHGNITRDPTGLAFVYTICIVFEEDPKWTRLWEKISHTITGQCVLPIDPESIQFFYTSIVPGVPDN